jgi:hypothetical protein
MNEVLRETVQDLAPDAVVEIVAESQTHKIGVAEILEGTKAEKPTIASGFLRAMHSTVQDIAEVLIARRWGIVCSEKPSFATSDCPVIFNRGTCQRRVFGFRTPGTKMLFPCSPTRRIFGNGLGALLVWKISREPRNADPRPLPVVVESLRIGVPTPIWH